MNYKTTCFVILIFSLLTWHLKAQLNQNNIKIGGLDHGEIEKVKLEDACFRVIYQFKYPVIENKKISSRIDTMALVAGYRFSIYFDWGKENRTQALNTFFTVTVKAPENIITLPYSIFAEKAVDDSKSFNYSMEKETAHLYKDRNTQRITIMDFDDSDIMEYLFFYNEEKTSPINWEIKEDSASVLGYTCSKATCVFEGRSYSAWFTQDIPINDGPYKFYGLPGLILKIEDSEQLFRFVALYLDAHCRKRECGEKITGMRIQI